MNDRDTVGREHLPILFVGGAGLPSWIWDDVAGLLRRHACTAAAPPSAGATSHRRYAEQLVQQVGGGPIAVVGHSLGVCTALAMTAVDGIEIRALLAIAGLVPGEQQSFVGALPRPRRWITSLAIRVAGTTPPAAAIRQGLCSRVDDGTTTRIIDDFRGSPRSQFLDPVGPRRLPARRGYVVTTEDRELSTDLQRAAASALRTMWCKDLPTGHLPMLEDPDGLAEAVDAFLTGADEPVALT